MSITLDMAQCISDFDTINTVDMCKCVQCSVSCGTRDPDDLYSRKVIRRLKCTSTWLQPFIKYMCVCKIAVSSKKEKVLREGWGFVLKSGIGILIHDLPLTLSL